MPETNRANNPPRMKGVTKFSIRRAAWTGRSPAIHKKPLISTARTPLNEATMEPDGP